MSRAASSGIFEAVLCTMMAHTVAMAGINWGTFDVTSKPPTPPSIAVYDDIGPLPVFVFGNSVLCVPKPSTRCSKARISGVCQLH